MTKILLTEDIHQSNLIPFEDDFITLEMKFVENCWFANVSFKGKSLNGIRLTDGSTAINQANVGGLRIVELINIENLEQEAWNLGYNWVDYITSWNDLKTRELEIKGWVIDHESVVPWRLNPIEKNYFNNITFLSEKPLDNEFIVHRSYSDHGRIGSL